MATLENRPLAELRKLTADEQDTLLKQAAAITAKVEASKEANESSHPVTGKLLFVLEERLNAGIAANLIAKNTGLETFVKTILGDKLKISPRAFSCKNAWAFVVAKLITEKDYGLVGATCLELGASILRECGNRLDAEEVLRAAQILRERPDKKAALLRAIRDSLKGPRKIKHEKALEMFNELYNQGYLVAGLYVAAEHAEHIQDSFDTYLDAGSAVLDQIGTLEIRAQYFAARAAKKAAERKAAAEKAAGQNAGTPATETPAPAPAPAETPVEVPSEAVAA